jgi:hypothetical protein
LPVCLWLTSIQGDFDMAELIAGYTCPTCCLVVQDENCSLHPDALMDLFLNNEYQVCQDDDDSPWRIVLWDDNHLITSPVCSTSGRRKIDRLTAEHIATALNACREIPTAALENGYIQTLQQLPLLVSDHLNNLNQPTAAIKNRLRKQLALIQSRGRSIDCELSCADFNDPENDYCVGPDDESDDDDNDVIYSDTSFDTDLPKLWQADVWKTITDLLQVAGFKKEEVNIYSQKLKDGRLVTVKLDASYKHSALEVSIDFAICHENLIKTMQQLTHHGRDLSLSYSRLQTNISLRSSFSDTDKDAAEELVAMTKMHSDRLFNKYPDLHSICLGLNKLTEPSNAYIVPIAQTLLGNHEAALAHIKEWCVEWSKDPINDDHIAKYIKDCAQVLKAIKPIAE